MRKLIKSILEDEEYTDEVKQDRLDDLLIDRLRYHEFEDCKLLIEAGAKNIYPFNAEYFSDALETKFLIENGVQDINLKDENGKTLYSYAECGYDITRKKGFKKVMDYLAFKGAKKIVFSDQEKEILRRDYKETCVLVGLVERGDIPKQSIEFYEMKKLAVKYGMLRWGLLDKVKDQDSRER